MGASPVVELLISATKDHGHTPQSRRGAKDVRDGAIHQQHRGRITAEVALRIDTALHDVCGRLQA